MLSRDSEDQIWSRVVFELVIWWTQPWGPLCLWQCLKLDLSTNSHFFTTLFGEWRHFSELKYFYFLDWIPRKSPLTLESHHHFGLFTLVMAHCGTDTRKKNTMLTCWSPRPWRRLPCFHWTRCRPHCITLAFSHLVTRIKAMIWQNLEVQRCWSLEYGRMTQDNIVD